jgi:hypothetical protein
MVDQIGGWNGALNILFMLVQSYVYIPILPLLVRYSGHVYFLIKAYGIRTRKSNGTDMKALKHFFPEIMLFIIGFSALLNLDPCLPPRAKLKLEIMMYFCFSAGIGLLVLKKFPRLSIIFFLIAYICAFIGWSLH